jgi:hypothetical protein
MISTLFPNYFLKTEAKPSIQNAVFYNFIIYTMEKVEKNLHFFGVLEEND